MIIDGRQRKRPQSIYNGKENSSGRLDLTRWGWLEEGSSPGVKPNIKRDENIQVIEKPIKRDKSKKVTVSVSRFGQRRRTQKRKE